MRFESVNHTDKHTWIERDNGFVSLETIDLTLFKQTVFIRHRMDRPDRIRSSCSRLSRRQPCRSSDSVKYHAEGSTLDRNQERTSSARSFTEFDSYRQLCCSHFPLLLNDHLSHEQVPSKTPNNRSHHSQDVDLQTNIRLFFAHQRIHESLGDRSSVSVDTRLVYSIPATYCFNQQLDYFQRSNE